MAGITDRIALRGTGECAGSTGAKAFPAIRCHWAKFKAAIDNAGNVNIGLAGVTKPAGSDTTTAGWPLDGGQETDWIPVPGGDLSNIFLIGDNAGDDVIYMYG